MIIIKKIDADGQTQWSNTFFGSMEYDPGYSIQPTSDSGYIIAGWTKTYENPNQIYGGDALLLKLDSYGNQEWVQAYEGFYGQGLDYFSHVQQTSDGGYIAFGVACNVPSNDWSTPCGVYRYIVKTDSYGNVEWENKSYPNSDDYFRPKMGVELNDISGGYIFISSDSLGLLNSGGFETYRQAIIEDPTIEFADFNKSSSGGYYFGGNHKYIDTLTYEVIIHEMDNNLDPTSTYFFTCLRSLEMTFLQKCRELNLKILCRLLTKVTLCVEIYKIGLATN